MKKNMLKMMTLASLLTMGLTSSIIASENNQTNPLMTKKVEFQKIKTQNAKSQIENLAIMKQARLNVEKVIPTNGLYYVSFTTPDGKRGVVYVSSDYKLMIHSGQAISTETGVPFAPPVNVATFEGKESFTIGTGKETLYVFTDPQCPFCQRFEKTLKNVDLKNKYKLKVYMLPLSFHDKAPEMTHWILSAKTDKEKSDRLLAIAEGSTKYQGFLKKESVEQYKKIESDLTIIKKLAMSNAINGTPTVLNGEGKAINWQTLQY